MAMVEKSLKVLKEIYQKLIVQGNKEFGQHLKIVEDLYNNQLNILINELNDIKFTKLGKQDCQRCLGKEYYLPYWSVDCHKKLIRIDDERHTIAAQLKLLPFYPSQSVSHISRMSNLRDNNNFSNSGNNSMNEEKNAGKLFARTQQYCDHERAATMKVNNFQNKNETRLSNFNNILNLML